MHIDNPQMRGLFFCGVTRHVCRGYDRLRILGGPPPRAKLLQGLGELAPSTKPVAGAREVVTNARGAHSPSAITRMSFGVMDIECLLPPQGGVRGRHYSVKGSITKRASESVKKRTYNLPSLTYARKADISNTNTCGSTLVESTASTF